MEVAGRGVLLLLTGLSACGLLGTRNFGFTSGFPGCVGARFWRVLYLGLRGGI